LLYAGIVVSVGCAAEEYPEDLKEYTTCMEAIENVLRELERPGRSVGVSSEGVR